MTKKTGTLSLADTLSSLPSDRDKKTNILPVLFWNADYKIRFPLMRGESHLSSVLRRDGFPIPEYQEERSFRTDGKESRIPVHSCTIDLVIPAISDSGIYRISCSRKIKGSSLFKKYTIYCTENVPQNPWNNPLHPGKCVPWNLPGNNKRIEGFTDYNDLFSWMEKRIGKEKTQEILNHAMIYLPEKIKEDARKRRQEGKPTLAIPPSVVDGRKKR